jgi:hypothetical protein
MANRNKPKRREGIFLSNTTQLLTTTAFITAPPPF